MARTLEEIQREFNSATIETRNAYDEFNSWKSLFEKADAAFIKSNQAKFDKAQKEYKAAQEKKNALRKELTAAEKLKVKTASEKAVAKTYNKTLSELKSAERELSGYKGTEKYQEAYRRVQAAYDEAIKAGASVSAPPTPRVEVPPVDTTADTGDQGTGQQGQVAAEDLKALVDRLATDPVTTKIYQKALQPFGYSGPVDGQYSIPLGQAIASVAGQRASLPEVLQGKSLTEFIQNPANVAKLGIQTGSTGAGAPIPYRDISAPTEAAATIQRVFDAVLGREATKKEITAFTKILNKEEERNPSKTVNGRRTGGINRDQFLADLIKAGTYEADKKAFPGILSNVAKEYSTSKQAATATAIEQLRQTAMANGLDLDANFGSELKDWQAKIAAGANIDDYKNKIRTVARQHLPESIRGQIDPTIDLKSAYAPYINSYSATFGIPANQVKVADIERIALTDKGFAPIWEFEAKKRSLPGWDQTPEAYDYVDSVANQVLRDFGF